MPPPFAPPSNTLWIGNLSTDVTESDLDSLFRKFGVIDSITSYASRSFAFICYKNVDDAKAAKEALQGHVVRGNPIRIQFAKLAKPCKSLWVAGISPSVSKEALEAEFEKFGKIQEFKFLKDRNTAFVDYFKLEDASQALKTMNGKRIGGDQIRVDFLRSQPAKREHWSENIDAREGPYPGRGFHAPDAHWMPPDAMRNYSEPVHAGSKRHLFPQGGGRRGDGQPSNILWISYPPTVHVEEDMLHNAMILFGEIEKITTYPDRNYSFVEFRSVDEARLAKEGLQGKLFNDSRIMIDYSSSGFGPGKDAAYYPGIKGPRPDTYFGEDPFGSRQVEMLGPNHHRLQNNVPPNIHGRGTRGHGSRAVNKPGSSGWDVFDASQRESKRSRMDSAGMDEQYGFGSVSGSLANLRGKNCFSPEEGRGAIGGIQPKLSDDEIWRGVIAKGGTPVCQARCIPFREEGVEFNFPEVVDCSARTGLDTLAKHYADAVGFNLVFFLPDSEEDFASYTEFLRYLGSKNRAGVAKCDDGTTLFLVPPSDFLTDVLNVAGPERLYGVVLKFRSDAPNDSISQPHYVDQQHLASSQTGYNAQTNYARNPHEDTQPPSRTPGNSALPVSSSAMQQLGLTLTPELIATLASLLPANSKPPGMENASLDKGVHQNQEQTGHLMQPLTNQYNHQGQHVAQVPAYPLDSNAANYSVQSQMQDGGFSSNPQLSVSSKPLPSSSYMQAGQGVYPHQVEQQYQQAVPIHGSNALLYGSSGHVQSTNPNTLPNQVYGSHVAQRQSAMQLAPESALANQAHQLQSGPTPLQPGQATSEGEGDKNERYRTTLMFAANLLSQIQKQPGNYTGKGPGSH